MHAATRTGPAAHGMFWYDPVTETGVVEPMRTHDDHQQRGLARHVLTTGVGFEPGGSSDLFAGPTS